MTAGDAEKRINIAQKMILQRLKRAGSDVAIFLAHSRFLPRQPDHDQYAADG
jgi:hypothetical protein